MPIILEQHRTNFILQMCLNYSCIIFRIQKEKLDGFLGFSGVKKFSTQMLHSIHLKCQYLEFVVMKFQYFLLNMI